MDTSLQTYIGVLGYLIDHGDTHQGLAAVEQMENIMKRNRRRIRPESYIETMSLLQMARLVIVNTNEGNGNDRCD